MYIALLKMECKKLFASKRLWMALVLTICLSIADSISNYITFQNSMLAVKQFWNQANMQNSATIATTFWLPIRNFTYFAGLFFQLWPLIASLAFSWSWVQEQQLGYLSQLFMRATKTQVYLAKATVAMLSGALIIIVPYTLNILCNLALEPMGQPWIYDEIFIGISKGAVFSSLFFSHPLIFVLVWTLCAALLSGLWALFSSLLSCTLKSFIKGFIAGYAMLLICEFFGAELFGILQDVVGRQAVWTLAFFTVVEVYSLEGQVYLVILYVVLMVLASYIMSKNLSKREIV